MTMKHSDKSTNNLKMFFFVLWVFCNVLSQNRILRNLCIRFLLLIFWNQICICAIQIAYLSDSIPFWCSGGVASIWLILVGEVVTGVSGRSLKSRVATLAAAAAAAGQEQQHKTPGFKRVQWQPRRSTQDNNAYQCPIASRSANMYWFNCRLYLSKLTKYKCSIFWIWWVFKWHARWRTQDILPGRRYQLRDLEQIYVNAATHISVLTKKPVCHLPPPSPFWLLKSDKKRQKSVRAEEAAEVGELLRLLLAAL